MNRNNNTASPHRFTGLVLFLSAIVIFGLAGFQLRVPGYMDAEYYFMNGQQLASGNGFNEMVIWNFLDDPQGLPHPSHTYWLPFTSIIAALGMWLFRNEQFIYAQIPFLIISASIPVITYRIGRLLFDQERKALFAGILAFFPGYYLAYQLTTSSLGLYMLGGGLFFWVLLLANQQQAANTKIWGCFAILGCIAGIMHLTRADGILWLFSAFIAAVFIPLRGRISAPNKRNTLLRIIQLAGLVFGGYCLVMGFWFVHNWHEFGRVMPVGGMSTLWLQDYNQMFAYPAKDLNPSKWLQSGMLEILSVRIKSSLNNLVTLLIVEGEIILLPLIGLGLYLRRKNFAVRTMLFLWLLTFGFMSWIFPFAGMRGGFLHSSAAFQPFFWALVPAGYDQFILWGVKLRNWYADKAWKNFQIGILLILAVFGTAVFYSKVIGSDSYSRLWQADRDNYVQVEMQVRKVFPDTSTVIVINNPPGYFLASGGRPAVVLPDGDETSLVTVADKFQAEIIAIDKNTVDELKHLYFEPVSDNRLEYLFTVKDTRIYRVRGEDETP